MDQLYEFSQAGYGMPGPNVADHCRQKARRAWWEQGPQRAPELLFSGLLIHTNLRAELSPVTTASAASMSGGAVGQSQALSATADRRGDAGGQEIPVLALSLFNGIGCRCYDSCGLTPCVAIAYEVNAAASRVTSRRWPNVKLEGDVRSSTANVIRDWRYQYPQIRYMSGLGSRAWAFQVSALAASI